MKSIIILGSARSDGNTKKFVDTILEGHQSIDLVDLNDYEIGYFDYEFSNQNDDFIPLCERLVSYDNLIFASPVYWYSMSAQLKTFFDRITDLMKIRKDLGKKLNGKYMMSVSCGSGPELQEGFEMPFKESANYLKMTYLGHLHGFVEDNTIEQSVKNDILAFLQKLKNHEKSFSN
jgi:multimeric flavodoxin WrbA